MILYVNEEYDYIREFQNTCNIVDEMLQEAAQSLTIHETMTLYEGGDSTLSNLLALQEADNSNKKGIISRLITAIASMWSKFTQKVTQFVKGDKGFLEKYKDVILKKPFKEESYTMYPYWEGTKLIMTAQFPAFNYSSLKDDLVSEEEFIKKYFKKYEPTKDDMTFLESCKIIFRGGQKKEIQTNSMNMTDIYNYCVDYENIIKKLNKDLDEVDKASKECIKLFDKVETDIRHSQEQQQSSNSSSSSDNSGSSGTSGSAPSQEAHNNSAIFVSSQNSYYLIEDGLVTKGSSTSSGSAGGSGSTQAATDKNKVSKNINQVNGGEHKVDSEDNVKSIVQGRQEGDANDIDAIKTYLKVCSNFIAAKISIVEEAYKAYMFIIRDHVKSYSGEEKDTDNNIDPKKATDYSKNNNGKQKVNNNSGNSDNNGGGNNGQKLTGIRGTINLMGNKVKNKLFGNKDK